jgi:hypothetical protein
VGRLGSWQRVVRASVGAVLFSLVCAVVAHRFAPDPTANTERASEDAFSAGLEEREFVPPLMGPGRWTTAGASFRFRYLPKGPAKLEVRVRNHQNAVRVLVDRVPAGLIAVDDRSADIELDLNNERLRVDLVVKPFLARGGRRLGTFLDRVTLVHSRSFIPPASLVVLFVVPSAACALAAVVLGASTAAALGTAMIASVAQTLSLWPCGVLRSDYSSSLALLLLVAVALAYGFARWIGPVGNGLACPAFWSVLAACLVQGVAATHPLVVGLDAAFHGHKLAEVAYGNFFPESLTQHRPPFRFPYGVTFYLLLSPLARSGFDLVRTVRAGASVAGIVVSVGIFWFVVETGGRTTIAARQAMASVILYQFVPWTFKVFSNGNYSNVFAQAAVAWFFIWWATGRPLGWAAGCTAFVLGAIGHLSSFLFLLALVPSLVWVHRDDLERQRRGLVAVGAGLLIAALYYAHFAPLILEQLPRLWEGGRGGTGTGTGVESLIVQLKGVAFDWGVPAVVLAWVGRPRGKSSAARDLRAFWLAGAILAALAVTTPIEARYLFALTVPLALASGYGLFRLWGLGTRAKVAASILVALQLLLGFRAIVDGVLYDWRI